MARRGRPTVEIPVCGAAGHAHEPGCKASTSPRSQVFLPAGRDALATFAFQHVTAARDNGYWRCPPSKLERRSPRSHCAREPVEPLPFVDLSLRLVAAASPRGRRSTSVCGRPGLHQRGRKCRPECISPRRLDRAVDTSYVSAPNGNALIQCNFATSSTRATCRSGVSAFQSTPWIWASCSHSLMRFTAQVVGGAPVTSTDRRH